MRGRTDRGRLNYHGGNDIAQDYTTFFFSNFPRGFGEIDMLKIFQKWARVKEVFISRRLNKWGRRFGFVSFFGVRNAGRLKKELDQVYIGSRKLYVNIPKYKRTHSESRRLDTKVSRVTNAEKQTKHRKRYQIVAEPSGKQSSQEIWVEKKGRRSYAEAVMGEHSEQWKGPSITTHFSVFLWMKRSVIGKLRDAMDLDRLGEEIVKGGMGMLRLKAMGDNLIMLTPREGESMEEIIKLNGEWFDNVFASIMPWTVSSGSSHKLVWVRCYGLPLPYWNRDCFGIVTPSASLIYINKATESWEMLAYARLQVRILKVDSARLAKCVQINKQLCNIFIEEAPLCSEDSYKIKSAPSESSDSVSSSETYVEETNFTANNGLEEYRLWEGEDYWSNGAKEGREAKEEDEQCSQTTKPLTTKLLIRGYTAKNITCQGKSHTAITNVARNEQKVSEDVDFYLSEGVCGAVLRNAPTQAEVACLVMDIECGNNLEEANVGLGCAREMKAAHCIPTQVEAEQSGFAKWPIEVASGGRGAIGNTGKNGESLVGGSMRREYRCSRQHSYGGSPMGADMRENGSPKNRKEGEGVEQEEGIQEDDGTVGVAWLHAFATKLLGEGGLKARSMSNSPLRRRKKKVLSELGDSSSNPRRSARISVRLRKADATLVRGDGVSMDSISDKDINFCNSRWCSYRAADDPTNLWDSGKRFGIACRGDEVEVINEHVRMEARDEEVVKCDKKGDEKGD